MRLVNGFQCSGRLEARSNQSWVSVCEDDFDQQDAEVVCQEIGCGPPSVLQGALYGEGKGPVWPTEFQCQGNETRLLDCDTSDSARITCSPGNAVGLTCSGKNQSFLSTLSPQVFRLKSLISWYKVKLASKRLVKAQYLPG